MSTFKREICLLKFWIDVQVTLRTFSKKWSKMECEGLVSHPLNRLECWDTCLGFDLNMRSRIRQVFAAGSASRSSCLMGDTDMQMTNSKAVGRGSHGAAEVSIWYWGGEIGSCARFEWAKDLIKVKFQESSSINDAPHRMFGRWTRAYRLLWKVFVSLRHWFPPALLGALSTNF